ncbi:uncharacterized protein LOC126657101 [Mercurialis annua]|uniref:uncharacterized protein LOC126657101 n=1 Tax=Mercurialis annua TaxID=3986 RepID=UPI00215E42E7|nr:uncharacterized protein LOC126657101 [Mercurialis annua]
MNSLSWNVRGLNDSLKQAEVQKLLVNKKIMFARLLETGVGKINFERIWKKLNLQGWKVIENYDFSDIGRIWVVYNSKITVDVLYKSDQLIHCKVTKGDCMFYWSAIYEANDIKDRQSLWLSLNSIARSIDNSWAIQGDFNAVMSDKDRCGGNSLDLNHATEMANCMAMIWLVELRSIGWFYTWSNNQINNIIWRRIDRAPVNGDWQNKFQKSFFEVMPNGISYHSPLIINIMEANYRKKSSFRYLNLWSQNPEHNRIIEDEWHEEYQGFTMFKIVKKLRGLKTSFPSLTKSSILKDIQLDPLDTSLLEEERAMVNHLRKLLISEESFYKQQSRINWLNLGDSNTKFFHNSVKQRRSRNIISILKVDSDRFIIDKDEIHGEMTNYCKNLFSNNGFVRNHIDRDSLRDGPVISESSDNVIDAIEFDRSKFQKECEGGMQSYRSGRNLPETETAQTRAITQQVYEAREENRGNQSKCNLLQLVSNGQRRDKGQRKLSKVKWEHTGIGSAAVAQRHYESKEILRKMTSRKKSYHTSPMSRSTGVSISDPVYVLAARISLILCHLISENQSAFIPKRSIAYNIMLAHKLVRNYRSNKGNPRCLMKIDLKKSYDSISWDFIEEMLFNLHFPDITITLIMNCIRNTRYSVNWNGDNGVCFSLEKLCHLKLNHLMFADDLMLFCHEDIDSVKYFTENLSKFKNTPGLEINPSKSQIFFCNVDDSVKVSIMNSLGFKEDILPLRYLGIPLISTRLSKVDCNGIISKITSRINSWTSNFLSYVGRLQLITSVLMRMHSFWASVVILPKNVVKNIQKICSRFLWNGTKEGRNNALASWDEMSKMKIEGGLRVKDISTWNRAAISKHIKDNKIKRSSFWGVKANQSASWIWRGIHSIKDDIKNILDYKIGDGTSVSFWNYPWTHGYSMLEKFPRVKMRDSDIPRDAKVADLWRNGNWKFPDPMDADTDIAWDYIRRNFVTSNEPDSINWKSSKNGKFSISRTWGIYRAHHDRVSWFKLVWGKNSIHKYNFIL